ncbi:MAG: hemolysin family protein [Candidatus Muiribacteriota bacterium]
MILWILFIIFVLIALSAFFSGIETGMISINKIYIKKLVDEKNKKAIYIQKILDNIEDFIIVTLIGNNIMLVAISIIATNSFLPFFQNELGESLGKVVLSGFIITPLMLLFAEILPKEIFRQRADSLVLKNLNLIRLSFFIFKIPGFILLKIFNIFKSSDGNNNLLFSKEEIEHLITASDKSGALQPEQKKMMEGIFELSDTQVNEIMTPRVNFVALNIDSTVADVFSCVEKHGYSRIPVYEESIDNISGFVFVLDIIHDKENGDSDGDIKKYIRKITFIPETKKIDELFTEMKLKKEQIRIVVDEHGQISGLVTLEDIIEEIVGEIQDEYDAEIEDGKYNKDGTLIINAMLSVDEINDKFNLKIAENDEYDTLGGFLEHVSGVIPSEGQEINWKNYSFKILKMNNNSVDRILLKVKKEEHEEELSENV